MEDPEEVLRADKDQSDDGETALTRTQGSKLERFLEELKLIHYYKKKLSLTEILQIDVRAATDEPAGSKTDAVWYFVKRLMMANVTARNCEHASASDDDDDDDFDVIADSDTLNPLDIITALFLCSDGFVQQELSLKMSMCQFAVPLLLPDCDTNQCTLMLWALTDIVKNYRPKSLSEAKGFKEESVVHSEIPMISFVRLGECSLSKSEILNKLLSNAQQYHDTFVHRNMQCGDSPRIISNGLAELTWYLPCGKKNIDIFDEPVAVVNLRGDITNFETQFSFLCQVSSSVFIFFDNFDFDPDLLRKTNQTYKEKIHFVVDEKNKQFNIENLKTVAASLSLSKSRILLKKKTKNDADFIKNLRKSVTDVIRKTSTKTPIEKMVDTSFNLGIHIDEYQLECQSAKTNAHNITCKIEDILEFKEKELPLQGQFWKDLTSIEKEECRLRKVGTESIEHYKSSLLTQKQIIRTDQNSRNKTEAMACFISAISSPGIERSFFLKWLRINLDNLSHDKLSDLREQYKRKCNDSENKVIKTIDRQLSNRSLGTEHFFREMGQLYEASLSLPEEDQGLQHLPKLCAQLLMDGFPLELVDGDASNIPLRWVSDVLTQLHELVSPNNKIRVITVLGVQSTGKSTLLNTMFGVQFAVSSGRCTRGAFMLLIRVSEDMKASLNCDFLVIIDTEGLKSPELAQLDDSHEHDNELATLVVGLSDITIINIAMENSTDMKDILQIVVHAFLRMKEVGKKPRCQFVHQNVSDVSAHAKNLRDRELLLQQLNEMTQAAAKMERKEENKSFADVMDYDPDTGNWYIPGLWNGIPPMAPVNVGYSEAVQELKKNVLHNLEKCGSSVTDILEFREWIKSLWNAVKHENFIFSFRNSLVADAYTRLCTEYNKWEWEFKKAMHSWSANAETRIKNVVTAATDENYKDIKELLTELKTEASTEVETWETKLLNNLAEYFKQERHVSLIEGYKQKFELFIQGLGKELLNKVLRELTATADMTQGQAELNRVKEKHAEEIEARVRKLIEDCKKRQTEMTDEDLNKEFDEMWRKTLDDLNFSEQKPLDVFKDVEYHLRHNLKNKGKTYEELSKKSLKECGLEPFKCTFELWKKGFHKISKALGYEDCATRTKQLADQIISECQEIVTEKVQRKNNYHETNIHEILRCIDDHLHKDEFKMEVPLKQHICADAARQFEKLQRDFLNENDPYVCLNKNKAKFCADFKDLFHERDQCQKKAAEFTERCLRAAVKDFVNRSLGLDIVDKMLTCEEFSTRVVFQHALLLDLLEQDSFKLYLEYTKDYEDYVKDWILTKIYSHSPEIIEFEKKQIQSCVRSITEAVNKAKDGTTENIKLFVKDICKELNDRLVISKEALDTFMVLNNADKETFSHWLIGSVNEMGQSLSNKVSANKKKIKNLHVKPQNELFTRVIGCGELCPFCSAPCDAGGGGHTEHWASLHRPQAFGAYRHVSSKKLITDICSSRVNSDNNFKNTDTKDKYHPYKTYKDIYPNWKIAPDVSLEASDFWKYVLTKFNDRFANAHHANPADVPETWKSIDKVKAKQSIDASFGIKTTISVQYNTNKLR